LQDISSTPVETLEKAYFIAREEGIKYVYIGNVSGNGHEHTFCPECGELLIKRGMFGLESYELTDKGACPRCGAYVNIVSDD
jgi:pyruvate formate lyase activating enzyme